MNLSAKILGIVLASALCEAAAVEPVDVTADVRSGAWMESFAAATNLAWQTKAPLVLFWANLGCEHCEALEAAVNTAPFKEWMAQHQDYVYCFVQGRDDVDWGINAGSGAKRFAATAGGTTSGLSYYPFICLYWPKIDGTVEAKRFRGISGNMSGAANGRSLAKQLSDAIEETFSAYVPNPRPDVFSFIVSDTEYDRLEAEPMTSYVDVPLVREIRTGGVATNRMVAVWPDGILPAVTNSIIWTSAETQKMSRVSLSHGTHAFPEGRALTLILTDASEKVVATGSIHFVAAKANSVHNPKFVGEDFAYGEWTMDYEAAKSKPGYVLANFSGGMWCPDCNGIDTMLFADPRFTEWAVSNRVSLVLFDQGLSTSPATAAGNGKARLLTYAAGPSYFREGRPMISGASYLSRKSISPSAAAARIAMTTQFTHDWLAPDSTAARLGNPTLLIVKDDKVMGRVNLHVDGYAYDPEENIARLTEALQLADGNGESDNYTATTTRTISDGVGENVSFQINDRSECFRITDAKLGVWRFSVTDSTLDVDVTVSVCTGGVAVVSGTGAVTVELTASMLAADPVLRLVAYPSEMEKVCTERGASAFTAVVTCAMVAPPTETDPHKLNPYLGKKRAKQIIPLLASIGRSELLTGTLTVSIASKDRITAKYAGAGAKTYSFTGTWQDQDKTSGTLTAMMERNGARLALSLAADGMLAAKVSVPGKALYLGGGDVVAMTGEVALPVTGIFARYAGHYTVQMPAMACDPEGFSAGGVALTLEMSSASAVKSGKVKYSAILPNGKAVSGSAQLGVYRDADGGEYAVLPVFNRTSQLVFGALLKIAPDGAGTWNNPHDAAGLDVVETEDGTVVYCLLRGKMDMLSVHETYGSWFKTGSTPMDICERFGLLDTFHAGVGDVAGSERYGAIVEVPSATLKAKGKKFSISAQTGSVTISSYAAKSGIIKGKGRIAFEGKSLAGRFACVVMPGWIDCHCGEGFVERPFAAGTFWFTDHVKQSGRWVPVVRSVPFEVAAEQR